MRTFSRLFGIIAGYIILTPSEPLSQDSPGISVLNDHDGFSIGDLVNGKNRFAHLNRIPMFKVEAISFTAVDESGIDFWGSDEVTAKSGRSLVAPISPD